MDLALTRRGDYAVRAALCLAQRGGDGRYVKIREIAQTMALPASYTPQVLRLLADAGLTEARAGRDGGYRLTRPPAAVALLEVVEAAEGAFTLERCILRGGPSPGSGPAPGPSRVPPRRGASAAARPRSARSTRRWRW